MTRQSTARSARGAGRRRADPIESESDFEAEEDYRSDADYFLDELRCAVDRAHSSAQDMVDLHDNPRGHRFDGLQLDLSD